MDELEVIIQRMIDAGEPEENIKLVIENYEQPDFQTDDAVSANAESQEGVVALKDTELAPVNTSLESQSMDPFVINGEKVSEQEFKEYQKDLAERDVLEKDESFFSATGFVDFFSDIATAAEEGWRQGELVDPSYELYNLGDKATDEDVLNFVNKNKEIARKNLGSAEMQDFNRIYEEEGGGFWGFIKGVVNNPSTLSTMLVSSISNQISSLRSDEVRAAGAAAAATGAVAGSAIPLPGVSTLGGAIAGGMGGTMGAMETGLTFAELLQEEAGGLDPDKIKKILKDPEKLADLKNRALNRGLAIAAVEMATLGIAKGVGGKLATAGFKRAPMVAAGVTGGIEIAGGGLGEVAGRYVADQEMDAAEIGFEAFAGLGSAPLTLGQQALNIQTNLDRVKVNKEINRSDYANIVDVFKPETKTDNSEIKISKIKNSRKILNEKVDAQVKRAEITKEEGDAIKKNFIKTQGTVNQVSSLNLSENTEVKIVELQKEKSSLEAQIKKVNDKALTGTQSERVDAINKEQQSIIKEDIFTSRTKAATELATGLEFKQEPTVFNTTEEYVKEIAKEEGISDKQASKAAENSNGVFLGCSGYQNIGDDKCKETLNLVSGDEAISIDDSEEAENLLIKKRCPKCDTSMDNYLIDENRKLHVCGKSPDCSGFLIEEGQFKIKGYDGPTLECHKCGAEMQLKTGRFGKYFGCLNDNCGATRALQRNGEPKPLTMEPIELPELKCLKCVKTVE